MVWWNEWALYFESTSYYIARPYYECYSCISLTLECPQGGGGGRPHADKSGQGVGSKNRVFCGRPLWTTPDPKCWFRIVRREFVWASRTFLCPRAAVWEALLKALTPCTWAVTPNLSPFIHNKSLHKVFNIQHFFSNKNAWQIHCDSSLLYSLLVLYSYRPPIYILNHN